MGVAFLLFVHTRGVVRGKGREERKSTRTGVGGQESSGGEEGRGEDEKGKEDKEEQQRAGGAAEVAEAKGRAGRVRRKRWAN